MHKRLFLTEKNKKQYRIKICSKLQSLNLVETVAKISLKSSTVTRKMAPWVSVCCTSMRPEVKC